MYNFLILFNKKRVIFNKNLKRKKNQSSKKNINNNTIIIIVTKTANKYPTMIPIIVKYIKNIFTIFQDSITGGTKHIN